MAEKYVINKKAILRCVYSQEIYCTWFIFVLDKTLKGIRGVRLNNRKDFFVHQILGKNTFSVLFFSFN